MSISAYFSNTDSVLISDIRKSDKVSTKFCIFRLPHLFRLAIDFNSPTETTDIIRLFSPDRRFKSASIFLDCLIVSNVYEN